MTRGLVQGEIVLRNRRGDVDVVLVPEPTARSGCSLLLAAWRETEHHEWTPASVASLWTADDLRRAADWWRVAARPAELWHSFAVWYGEPPIGFLVIERDTGTVAVDVCWLEHPHAARPVLTGHEAVPTDDDRRFSYWTIDMTSEAVLAVAQGLDALAGEL